MTAEELLADFNSRGISLRRKGTRIHYRAPSGTLTDSDKEALRAAKLRLLTLVPTDSSTPGRTPFEQAMADWQATEDRVRARFRLNGIQPSDQTLRAATWLAVHLDEGWSYWKIRKDDARDFLQAIVQGRCWATLKDDGHIVIRNVHPPETRARQ